MPEPEKPPPAGCAPNGNRTILPLLWPGLLLLLTVIIGCIGIIAVPIALHPAESATYVRSLADGRAIARIVALVVVVPAIALLALLDKINGAAAIAALSAIAGYVLGGTTPSGP